MNSKAILSLPMQENDANATTIGEYLKKLLLEVWNEGEGFSGKRPFGNSSWECDIYKTLITWGVIDGSFDEDGYMKDYDDKKADQIIRDTIEYVFAVA